MGTLASYEDANAHLDATKIAFVSDVDAEDEARAAYDEIASYIAHLWPTQFPTWDHDPGPGEEETPSLIRYIASLLMASYLYAKKYSEENLGENDYSARLEKRAIAKLEQLRAGSIGLWDKEYGIISPPRAGAYERGDFWPDDTYTPEYIELQRELDPELQPSRAFGMGMEL